MADLKLDKDKTAVLSISFFNGTTAQNQMVLGKPILKNARRVMDAARDAGVPVIHVVMGFREGYPEVNERNKLFKRMKENGTFKIGGEDVAIREEVKPEPGEVVVSRPRINAFYQSELETVLRARNVENVVLMGVATNLPVESTARYAADADYRVIVLEDCCASHTQEDHDWTVQRILPRFAEIASCDDFLQSVR